VTVIGTARPGATTMFGTDSPMGCASVSIATPSTPQAPSTTTAAHLPQPDTRTLNMVISIGVRALTAGTPPVPNLDLGARLGLG